MIECSVFDIQGGLCLVQGTCAIDNWQRTIDN